LITSALSYRHDFVTSCNAGELTSVPELGESPESRFGKALFRVVKSWELLKYPTIEID